MPKKQKSAAARQTWRSVALEEESLRFAESGGFLSLEEIEQPLYDPAQPFSAAADDVEAGDSGVGASQLELAQAEVDRLMRMHAAAPRGEDAAAEGERKEKRKRAKAARNDQGCSVADNAEGEAGGEAGDARSSWEPLGLHPTLVEGMVACGFSGPTPIQKAALPAALHGLRDVVGAAETGSGKTLAFGLPILHRLIEVTRMSLDKQRRQLESRPPVVVATPGRLWELMSEGSSHLQAHLAALLTRQPLELSRLRFFVLDEVDRMIEAGHFQETHAKRVAQHKPLPSGSAADSLMQKVAFLNPLKACPPCERRQHASLLQQAQLQCLAEEKAPPPPPPPPAPHLHGTPSASGDGALFALLGTRGGRSIVFCNAVTAVSRLRSLLSLLGLNVIALQGGMQQRARIKALERFRAASCAVLLATDVAARGLDVKGVEYVVHYQLPRSAEVYVHRSGRTARAAAAGLCVSLVEPSSSRAFRKLCHELSVPQGLDEYPMPPKTLAAALEAAKLAQKVDKAEHKNSRAAKQASSMRRMAEEMDLPVSSDDEEEEETRHSNGRQQAREAALVARQRDDLRRMLGKLGWPAGGAAAS
ncbi:hypothetical protein EMIHUDRAFT_213860 [Emiliania huxleyi CCMP1516]|uniref:ATP-dependent RNA helicase n=2 Tax=Emiliania huxleyi TaxID=2903 RepID=A0A0D3ILF8_EMIH1|nr:hypothetical protein EMIHUDRAFT_213860 [Emiliania huxleyi CCMP1516]EOD12093.1 hypothetical protein EMIHUDRAFT_213860 [Emiliania huxleyi CCMP1516]|eukprot:XP_005764522.1 hypothetical protein EMIHUDRAFT_213860 [Emiliania huxleyi CCMP1516]